VFGEGRRIRSGRPPRPGVGARGGEDFRILGPFEVAGTGGVVDLRGAKRRGLLACLVVHAGQPMSTDRLVEELWGASGSDGAARTVQTYVSQLRKLLRGEGAGLETRAEGYVLKVDPVQVDASRFERAITVAGAESAPGRRLAVLDEALGWWRGPPLGEFAGAGWADREARRLDALRHQARQRRYDALLDLGRAGEAVGELELLVDAHPLDERFWAQLMLALYRSGRQGDALGAYQHARRHLVDELGIEPGPELVDLEHRILDHDPTLATPTHVRVAVDQPRGASSATDGWYPRTFLLTDIVDSVSLWERDPPAMSDAVARHDALVHDAVGASGGELVRTKGEGDSTFSVFDHPAKAVAAAVAVQDAVGGQKWPTAVPLRVRAGVHTGDAEPRDGDWYGPAVNRAARLRALADAQETLVSGVTAGLVADQLPDTVRLLYRGRRVLRGIERPEEVWELVPAKDPRLSAAAPAWEGRLPVALTRFVGRGADFDQLTRLIEDERLVTLTGPGGSGKTRLAMEVARHAARQGTMVWLAELAPLWEEGMVAEAVAAAVGVEAEQDPLDELLTRPELLAGVLVLDNCEHLLGDCTVLTERLLATAPELRVLATSREPLGLAGERVWPVVPLDVPDESVRDREQLDGVESVELLLDRARAVRPDLDVGDDDVASVVQICRVLDGVPLAIELAAGRLRSLSFVGLAERLGDQLTVLARYRSAGRDDARHQTLRVTLDWSYDLLTEQQQTLAQRLSVFAGGFRLDAVEAVCGGDLDVLDGIDELVAKSLVTFDGVTARYRLLEPLRQYFAERLDESGEADVTSRAHAKWVTGLCERLGTRLREGEGPYRLRLGEEASNIELALRWAHDHDHAMATRIVGSLGQYWYSYDPASGRRWCGAVIEASAGVAPRLRAKALLSAGMMAQNDYAWEQSVAWLREALSIYRAEEAVAGRAASLYWLGRALAGWSDTEHSRDHAMEAARSFEEGLELCMRLGDRYGVGSFRIWLSVQAFESEDLDRSEQLANQVIEECSAADARQPEGQALCILAFIARRRGRDDAALELLHDAIALYRDLDDPWRLSGLLVDLAEQEAVMARGDEALQTLAESSLLDEQIGRLPGGSRRLAVAALVHLTRGQEGMSIAALGAYDAHPPDDARSPWTRVGGSVGWLANAVEATRARLDPSAVAAATATARGKKLEELIDELILQPARAAVSH
jgi:predicted ATPase/DNA-binding SARP family transcriptional activator/class 3 adenylate cyclase